jgi:phage tail sheath gpL-like
MISTAVGAERVSRVVGYKLKKGNFAVSSPNLPQRIFILGTGNIANQATMPVEKREITSAKEAGDLYGYGSPIYQIMRILRPVSGDGVGGIPTIVFPQEDASGATAAVAACDVTISSTATDSAPHYVVINGRKGLDGGTYGYAVNKGEADTVIIQRIVDTINAVIGAPVIAATVGTPVTSFTLTTKYAGAHAADLSVSFDDGGKPCGITYAASVTGGTGVVDLTDALASITNDWNTIVINPYGTATFDALEAFNGVPDPINPTGRFASIVMRPFICIWGSVEDDKDDLVTITNASARKSQVTHALAPAPLSKGEPWEAAANMAFLFAIQMQNRPHVDISGQSYPDMPVPADEIIGDMSDYNNRDFLAQRGCSTVDLSNGKYQVQDFFTTYHPDGEITPFYRKCRDNMIYYNIVFGSKLIDLAYIIDKAIVASDQAVNVDNVIKPKDVKQLYRSYADELGLRALITDVDFMKNSIQAEVSSTNPNRLDKSFRVKISGMAVIVSSDVEVGFSYGTV